MQDIYEIARAKEKELLVLAKQRIEKFSILKRIYDDGFLSELVRRKSNLDNHLLFWLVTDNPIAINFFQEIERNLEFLQPEDSVQKFETKLRQWDTKQFESTLTELEFAAEYKRRGYNVEIEPILPNGEKSDFCADKESMKIYFEVKCIFWERSLKDIAIIDDLSNRFSRLKQPFVFGIDLKESFQRNQTAEAARYIGEKLKQYEQISTISPFSFVYPENGEPIIKIEVKRSLPTGENGYYRGAVFGGGIKTDWNDLRRKISSGLSQLHPDHPGVLIIQPHGLETGQHAIQNALFGDLAVTILDGQMIRWKNRIFGKHKNKRLSAVIFSKKRLEQSGYVRENIVYHNQYAQTHLTASTFRGEHVTQFIPKIDDGKIRYEILTG